jgi:hypothetical protein
MSFCCCSKVPAQLVSRIVCRHDPREKQSNTLDRLPSNFMRKERISYTINGSPVCPSGIARHTGLLLDPAPESVGSRHHGDQ